MHGAFRNGIAELYAVDAESIELEGVEWREMPADFDPETHCARIEAGELVVLSAEAYAAWEHDRELRIAALLPHAMSDEEILVSDFTLLPLRKASPTYKRGRKVRAEYHEGANLVVAKNFTDIESPLGILSGLMVHFEWYCNDGSVGLDKHQVVKEYLPMEAETEMRLRRERQLDWLIASAKGTPIGPVFQAIFLRFAYEINNYRASGTDELADAVTNESGTSIAAMLDTVIAGTPEAPYTVRDAILYEIAGGPGL